MQAIITKYLGPTNFRGSRVKASAQAGSVTIPWDDAKDSANNHIAAALALIRKYGWNDPNRSHMRSPHQWAGRMAMGATPDGKGYCFVIPTCPADMVSL